MQDTRTYRGADVGSDHYLVAAKIRQKLRRVSKSSLRKKLDVDRLKDEAIKTNFCINLQNRFEILADTLQLEHETGIDVEGLWCNINRRGIPKLR